MHRIAIIGLLIFVGGCAAIKGVDNTKHETQRQGPGSHNSQVVTDTDPRVIGMIVGGYVAVFIAGHVHRGRREVWKEQGRRLAAERR